MPRLLACCGPLNQVPGVPNRSLALAASRAARSKLGGGAPALLHTAAAALAAATCLGCRHLPLFPTPLSPRPPGRVSSANTPPPPPPPSPPCRWAGYQQQVQESVANVAAAMGSTCLVLLLQAAGAPVTGATGVNGVALDMCNASLTLATAPPGAQSRLCLTKHAQRSSQPWQPPAARSMEPLPRCSSLAAVAPASWHPGPAWSQQLPAPSPPASPLQAPTALAMPRAPCQLLTYRLHTFPLQRPLCPHLQFRSPPPPPPSSTSLPLALPARRRACLAALHPAELCCERAACQGPSRSQ
jgi:hypothetical protein